ncbi:Protein YAE1, partial [Frankliniella fusca]
AGFREGAGVGKDNAFQSGFDAGYAEGFKAAFSLGKFNGVV